MAERIGVQRLPLDQVVVSADVQSRADIDNSTVEEYAIDMRLGENFPAVVVMFDGETYWLADGFHRYEAARQVPKDTILCDIRKGTKRDAILHSIQANQKHGLRRTNADKRKAVMMLLQDEEWGLWSDNAIANRAGVSQPFVSGIRRDLSYNDYKMPTERKVQRGDTTYTQDSSNIGKARKATYERTQDTPPVQEPEPERTPRPLKADSPSSAEEGDGEEANPSEPTQANPDEKEFAHEPTQGKDAQEAGLPDSNPRTGQKPLQGPQGPLQGTPTQPTSDSQVHDQPPRPPSPQTDEETQAREDLNSPSTEGKALRTPPFPQGTFGVIIADPPWGYDTKNLMGCADNHYSTMNMEEIAALPVPSVVRDDSILLLWTTWPMIKKALWLIEEWNFQYVTGFPWVKIQGEPQRMLDGKLTIKPAWGVGFWVRGCSEMVLVAKMPKARPPEPARRFLGILSERFEHSRKPENLYEYAETFDGPYLELFARRQRDGWTSWGNEV